jgi:hypothetical protein
MEILTGEPAISSLLSSLKQMVVPCMNKVPSPFNVKLLLFILVPSFNELEKESVEEFFSHALAIKIIIVNNAVSFFIKISFY